MFPASTPVILDVVTSLAEPDRRKGVPLRRIATHKHIVSLGESPLVEVEVELVVCERYNWRLLSSNKVHGVISLRQEA